MGYATVGIGNQLLQPLLMCCNLPLLQTFRSRHRWQLLQLPLSFAFSDHSHHRFVEELVELVCKQPRADPEQIFHGGAAPEKQVRLLMRGPAAGGGGGRKCTQSTAGRPACAAAAHRAALRCNKAVPLVLAARNISRRRTCACAWAWKQENLSVQ